MRRLQYDAKAWKLRIEKRERARKAKKAGRVVQISSSDDDDPAVGRGKKRKKPLNTDAFLDVDDIDTELLLDDIAAHRAEVHGNADADEHTYFELEVRAGKWTKKHKGVACDSIRGKATGMQAKELCAHYKLKQSATFSYKKFQVGPAGCLARAWCHKMHFC